MPMQQLIGVILFRDLLVRHSRTCAVSNAKARPDGVPTATDGENNFQEGDSLSLSPSIIELNTVNQSVVPLESPELPTEILGDSRPSDSDYEKLFKVAENDTNPSSTARPADDSFPVLSKVNPLLDCVPIDVSPIDNGVKLPASDRKYDISSNTAPIIHENSNSDSLSDIEAGGDVFAAFDISQFVSSEYPLNLLSPNTSALLGSLDLIPGESSITSHKVGANELALSSHRSDSTGEDETHSIVLNEDWDSSPSSPLSGIDADTPWSDLLTEGIDFEMCDIDKVAIFDDTCRHNLSSILSAISPDAASPTLPSTERMNAYLVIYKVGYGQQVPLIHCTFCRFNFVRGNLKEISVDAMAGAVLMLMMAAIGAVYNSNYEDARSLCLQSRNYISSMWVDRSIFTDDKYLPLLQAKLLTCMFNSWSGDVELIECALNDLPALSRCCAYGIQRRKNRDISSWSAWTTREGYHRLYWGIFTFMSNLNLAYGHGMVVRLTDLGLPLPESDLLWFANSDIQFNSLLVEADAPLTTDEAVARIFAAQSVNSNDIDKADRQLSKFAIAILLHMVLQNLGDTNQVLHFSAMGDSGRSGSSGMELEYIRTVSFEQIDRLTHYLIKCLLKLSNTRGRVSIESLAHVIKIRRCGASVTAYFKGLLSDPNLTDYLDPVVDEFAFRTLTRSTQANKAIYLSLPYVRGFIRSEEKPDSIEQILCFWESMLSLIAWIHGVEKSSAGECEMSYEERFVVESVIQMVESSGAGLSMTCCSESGFSESATHRAEKRSVAAQVAHLCHQIFMRDGKWGICKRIALVMKRLEVKI